MSGNGCHHTRVEVKAASGASGAAQVLDVDGHCAHWLRRELDREIADTILGDNGSEQGLYRL